MVEGIINMWWLAGFIILSAIILVAGILAWVKFNDKKFRSALWKLLLANALIVLGIIIHTAGILEFGTDTAQITEFVVGHLLLLLGFVALAVAVKNIKKISDEIGFA